MTDLLSDLETPSDAELISRVRGGDVAAYGELFSRHREAAHRLARQLVRGPDSDDLVSEAFAKVLSVLQGGGGPDVAFRAYLLTSVRRLHVDRMRTVQRLQTTDDMTPFDPGVPFLDTAVAGFESGAAAKAFASLPERWQLVLWHLEVEGQKPADIAPLLGMSANSVSALAYRAREGLRQAFLTMHISDLTETDCRWVNEHLGAFIRKGLSKRDTGKVQSHLDECRRCTAMYLELTEVNSNLAAIIGPLLLGAAASGYLASGGAGAAGVLGLLGKVKELVVANSGAATAAGVAAGVAAVATVAAVTFGGSSANTRDPVLADPPAAVSTPASAAPTLPTFPAAPSTGVSASASPAAAVATPTPTASPVAALAAGATPTPTDAPLGAPTDTPTPDNGPTTDPATPSSTIDLSGTTIDDGGVHLRATGSPDLPPTLTVRLSSDPVGVTFASSPDCTVAADGASAACTTVTGGSGARAPGAAKMVASTSYNAELPFSIPGDQRDTDISISVDVPDGYEVSEGSGRISPHHYTRVTPAVHDLGIAAFSDLPVTPRQGKYTLKTNVQITGTPPALITFSLAGGSDRNVRFDDASDCSVADDHALLTCSGLVDGSDVSFVLAATNGESTGVTITASGGPGWGDSDWSNNSRTATLGPASEPEQFADVELTVPAEVSPEDGGTYDVGGQVTGIPDGYTGTAEYIVTGAITLTGSSTDGCTPDGTKLTCRHASNGPVHFALSAADNARPTDITITMSELPGYHDPTPNTGRSGRLLPVRTPPMADVAVTVPTEVAPQDDGTYDVVGQVTGIPDGYTGTAEYTVTGAATLTGSSTDGCTADGTKLTCRHPSDGPVHFALSAADNARPTDITITMSELPGYHDPTPNTGQPTRLRAVPTDISLSNLTSDPFVGKTNTVRGRVSGVPPSTTITFTLTGLHVGDRPTDYQFTGMATAGDVTCRVEPTVITCEGVRDAFDTVFQVDHPSGLADQELSVTIAGVGVTESNINNNSRPIALP